jgi:hypothetical protein
MINDEESWNFFDLELRLMEELSGIAYDQTVKIPRRELLLKCHERHVRVLKNLSYEQVNSHTKFLNMFMFPVVKDMVETAEQERKSLENKK